MHVTFLGTGTSHGVPMIGCTCDVCRSPDPRDHRWRPSIVVRSGDVHLLVDTSTDLRAQALAFGVDRVDAILFTHSHADHILGLDEIRRFNVLTGRAVPVHADTRTLADLRRTFAYAFEPPEEQGGGIPQVTVSEVGTSPFAVDGLQVQPVPIRHGTRTILGFRIGGFAYLTDCSGIPEESLPLLRDVDVLVLGALRDRPHPTHFTVEEACEAAARVGAGRTFLTHMCHDLAHAATAARLPPGVALAYDGLMLGIGD